MIRETQKKKWNYSKKGKGTLPRGKLNNYRIKVKKIHEQTEKQAN